MRKIAFACLLFLASLPAVAAETIAFGNRVLAVGDATGKVIEVAGKPDRVVQEESKFGGATGERWEYYRDGKTIVITLRSSKVTRIEELR